MATSRTRTRKPSAAPPPVETYTFPESKTPMRPDVGTQAQFRKKKPPQEYRYDSSLAPELSWDGQNPAREQGEALIQHLAEHGMRMAELAKAAAAPERDKEIEKLRSKIRDARTELRAMSGPFLNWAGKAERTSFDVPTLPLFVHERLSTRAIIETLTGHKSDKQEDFLGSLFGAASRPIVDQVLRAYEHQDPWVNRMLLGDSLVIMNSLLHYESMGGKVQMIYMDPPYGVKFGSNFQPFVRKRDVRHGDDTDMTREPETVQAYRDTWELGLHSYLTYLRDRLLICRDLLAPTGSTFVQISDENVHHVREVMDEVFGSENFRSVISFKKTGGQSSAGIASVADYLLWYAKDASRTTYQPYYVSKTGAGDRPSIYRWLESPDKTLRRKMTKEEFDGSSPIESGWRIFAPDTLSSLGASQTGTFTYRFKGRDYHPGANQHWKTTKAGLDKLAEADRLIPVSTSLYYVRYLDDFPVIALDNVWDDTSAGGYSDDKLYVVQTNRKVIQRCLLMTTNPGDLVFDPTCGSGTTAYVSEQWGRRWITTDVSRVPLALARQRLLTATFPWYQLVDENRGPAGGFVYKRRQNKKGEEVGGIVPHITLKSIANNEPPKEEVLVDRPEETSGITRVSGPFWLEATIPTPVDWDGDGEKDSGADEAYGGFVERMLEVLRRSPILRLDGNKTIELRNIRVPARTLALSAEAFIETPDLTDLAHDAEGEQALVKNQKPVAFVFGPENGAVSEHLVWQAAREAASKSYAHLYVIGFAIQPTARELIEKSGDALGVPATYVQATPDLLMGDLLKNMRSSQIFSVCGLPEVQLTRAKGKAKEPTYQVELVGFDVFDPITMEVDHQTGNEVPAWFLDTDYNELSFFVSQAFFPRTGAWENLRRALRGSYDETVWDHLSGTKSATFEAGSHKQIAVKVIDQRGNELLVVKKLT